MRVMFSGLVKSVGPDDSSHLSVVTVHGYQVIEGMEQKLKLDLLLRPEQARVFAAHYQEDKAVRVSIEVEDSPLGRQTP